MKQKTFRRLFYGADSSVWRSASFAIKSLAIVNALTRRRASVKGKTKYWLYKQLGMSYQNFNRMVQNETSSIKLERIETLCQLLDCTPNELFTIDWEIADNAESFTSKHTETKSAEKCETMLSSHFSAFFLF